MNDIKRKERNKRRKEALNYTTKYLDSRFVDSFNAPLTVILSSRGLGKTFHYKLKYLVHCIEKNRKMIYVVDSKTQIDTLCENNGEKFFSDIINVLSKETSNRKKKWLSYFLGENNVNGEIEVIKDGKKSFEIKKGVITINNKHYGYIISLNDFSNIKRNSFTEEYDRIIVDEFIPENQDIRTLRNPYKLTSIFQSIFRRRNDVKCVMLANTVRQNDPILIRLRIDDLEPRQLKSVYVNNELTMVAYRIAKEDYPEVSKDEIDSFSGKMNYLFDEMDLQNNDFGDSMDKSLLITSRKKSRHIFTIYGENGNIRVHRVEGEGLYYILDDYQKNSTKKDFCVDKNLQRPGVLFNSSIKDMMTLAYSYDQCLFANFKTYNLFKEILGIK